MSSTRRRGRVSYQAEDVDRQYGATWLLDKVAEETGVKDDLLKDRHESRFPARDDIAPKEENEVARPSRKWKNKSFRYTKLKNSEIFASILNVIAKQIHYTPIPTFPSVETFTFSKTINECTN